MQSEEQKKLNWFFKEVEPYDGFKVRDYYGIAVVTIKKNSTWDIRLQYDYEKNHKNGTPFKIDDIDELLDWYRLLDKHKKDKSSNRKIKKYIPEKEDKDGTDFI